MIFETLYLNDNKILPEIFLGVSILYLLLYGLFNSLKKNYPLVAKSSMNLAILILILAFLLLKHNFWVVDPYITFNKTLINDFLSTSSKSVVLGLSIIWFLITKSYVTKYKINNFEYSLLILFSVLGLCLMCSANDLITIYLSLELQSLAFYVLASFKRKSIHSVDAGLKYYILGSLSSCLFLFGSSLIYGLTGTVNLTDLKDLFFWATPTTFLLLSDLEFYHNNGDKDVLLRDLYHRLDYTANSTLIEEDVQTILRELTHITTNFDSTDKNIKIYMLINDAMIDAGSTFKHNLCARYSSLIFGPPLSGNFLMGSLLEFYVRQIISYAYYLEFSDENSSFESLDRTSPYYINSVDKLLILSAIISKMDCFILQNDYQQINYFNGNLYDLEPIQFSVLFIFASLFLKLAIAPFHSWLPDVYEGSPTNSAFFFSVVSKLPIFIIVLRLLYYSFYAFLDFWRPHFVIIALFSIFVGSFVGIRKLRLKSLLAYSSIAHMGYILLILCSGTNEAIQVFSLYFIVYLMASFTIWSVVILFQLKKEGYDKKINSTISDLSLLFKSNRSVCMIFAASVFSIAGLPPLVGFIAKFSAFLCLVESYMYFSAITAILFSLVSTFFYLRIIKVSFFENLIVGKLYFPIKNYSNTLILSTLFYFLSLFMINPQLLYTMTYKFSLLFFN